MSNNPNLLPNSEQKRTVDFHLYWKTPRPLLIKGAKLLKRPEPHLLSSPVLPGELGLHRTLGSISRRARWDLGPS